MEDKYLELRKNVLDYSYIDMNLNLESNDQVYISVIDIPLKSTIKDNTSFSLGLIFGLNCHMYFSNGLVRTNLEQDADVMKAMMTFLVNSSQVINNAEKIENHEFYESENKRVYLKTKNYIYLKEIVDDKESAFLEFLINDILKSINKIS